MKKTALLLLLCIQKLFKFCLWQRFCKIISLEVITSVSPEEIRMFFCLHTLSNYFHIQTLCQINNGNNDVVCFTAAVNLTDKAHIQL